MGHSRNWKDNALCHYHDRQVDQGATEEFACDEYVSGRYVSVSKGGQLTICEAVVHGYAAGEYEGLISRYSVVSGAMPVEHTNHNLTIQHVV